MNANEAQRALFEAAIRLKRSAPNEWAAFLHALSANSAIDFQSLLGADPSSILHAQGRAFAMSKLCDCLANPEALLAPRSNAAKVKGTP